MIVGPLNVCGILALVPFDSGASHSFVSSSFAKRLASHPLQTGELYKVSLQFGEVMNSAEVFAGCPVLISGRELHADLIKLGIKDFDIILGMTGLFKHYASIDCRGRIIIFNIDGALPFSFQGSYSRPRIPVLSTVKARKCIRSGCDAYLAFVTKEEGDRPTLEHIPVVKEFPDVFPNDIKGVPPQREVEFEINLIPGAGTGVPDQ